MSAGRFAVVVAGHEMLAAGQGVDPRIRSARRDIAKMPALVFGPDYSAPTRDQGLVMRHDRRDRAFRQPEDAGVAEMGVAREEDGHGFYARRLGLKPRRAMN
jgi:hypothetical protein